MVPSAFVPCVPPKRDAIPAARKKVRHRGRALGPGGPDTEPGSPGSRAGPSCSAGQRVRPHAIGLGGTRSRSAGSYSGGTYEATADG